MRPVSLRVFLLAALSSALPLACASLLGDFSAGAAGSGGDGGMSEKDGSTGVPDSSGSISDEGGPRESGSPDVQVASDGNPGGGDSGDGASPPSPLACQIPPTSDAQQLGAIQINPNNYDARLFNISSNNQTQFRFAVNEQPQNGPSIFHVYTFGQGNNGNGNDTPVPQSNVLALVRYATGIGALMNANIQSGNNNYNVLQVSTLEDSATTWATPVQITSNTQILTDCGANNYNIQGALVVNDAATQSYTAIWSCASNTTSPSQNVLRAMIYANGTGTAVDWPTPPLGDAGADGLQFGGLAASGQNLYVVANANGNGPAPGAVPTIYTADTSSPTAFAAPTTYTVPLTDPTDFMQVVAVQGTNGGNVGFAGLEANLTTPTLTPYFYVGSVPPSKMGSLVPSTDLGATLVPNISSLPIINGGGAHWESFSSAPASDNLLALGPVDPDSNGLNFMWMNGQGAAISQRVDTSSFFYYSTADGGTGPTFYGGDISFSGEPGPTYAQLELVYLEAGSLPDGGAGVAIWATQIVCITP